MKIIQLSHNKNTLVDDEDYEYLSQWEWKFKKNGRSDNAYRTTEYLKNKKRNLKHI